MTHGKKYIRGNGKWMDTSVTTAEVLEQERENEKNGKSTCQLLRSEAVNGEAAVVYSLNRQMTGFKEDSQIWISQVNRDTAARGAGRGLGRKDRQSAQLRALRIRQCSAAYVAPRCRYRAQENRDLRRIHHG